MSDVATDGRLVELARDLAEGRPATLEEALSAIADQGWPVVVSGRWRDAYGTLEEWLELDPLLTA